MNIKVTAIGVINLMMNLQNEKILGFIFNSAYTIFSFTINPTKIAINNPPSGNIILDVNSSRRTKNVIPNIAVSDKKLNDRSVPNPINQVNTPNLIVASDLLKEYFSIKKLIAGSIKDIDDVIAAKKK